jgi:hypothetical protein
MLRFPNSRDEIPLLALKGLSGSMGLGVSMGGILRLSACRSGLRIGMFRLFGPFCRDFFVPWSELGVSRKTFFGWKYAEIRFGECFAKLQIPGRVADQLWRAIPESWPENGSKPLPETRRQAFSEIFKKWAMMTALASAFFLITPHLMGSRGAGIPAAVAILFPAIVFGLGSAIEYWRR